MLLAVCFSVVVAVVLYDLTQKHHAILRTFPLLGHFRYLLERIGPELRQYIITDNNHERPFSRDQRSWVYASAKQQNNYFGFGTDNDLENTAGQIIIKHAAFPALEPKTEAVGIRPSYHVPSAKIWGQTHNREHAFRPESIANISGMSFGALSARAVEALNRGAHIAGCLHNTGEGGLSPYHQSGGELIFQIGTAYFGVRELDGTFSMDRLEALVSNNPVRAIEIKLSQGAKPGHGGVLPAAKITPELAKIRNVEMGKDCVSPAGHSAFSDVYSLLEFIEQIAERTGLPVGIKSAVGHEGFWLELAQQMRVTGTGPDFITIDGSEGGTGAAPLVYSDHVSLPFKLGFSRVYSIFANEGIHEDVAFIGSGRLGFPEEALLAFALGCDGINVGREAMMSIGCIQAQRCHTNHCPTGVATQSKWLMRGLDPQVKSARCANYILTLRKELLEVSRSCGALHPAFIRPDTIEILDDLFAARPLTEVFGYEPSWGRPSDEDLRSLVEVLTLVAPEASRATTR